MRAVNPSQNQDFWREHSAAWKSSGLTRQAYCEQEGISYRSFIYQNNRLMGRSKKAPLNFIEAKLEPTVISSPTVRLQLILPNGIRIDIGAEINPVVLQTVLRVAGAVQCLS